MFGFSKTEKARSNFGKAMASIEETTNEINNITTELEVTLAETKAANDRLDANISASEQLLRDLGYGDKVNNLQRA